MNLKKIIIHAPLKIIRTSLLLKINILYTHIYLPMNMEETECSETSAYKLQTPGYYPKKYTTYRTRRKLEIKNFLHCLCITGSY